MINLAISDDSNAIRQRIKYHCEPVTPFQVHMTSSQVTKTFISKAPHRKEEEPWASCHCIHLIKTHRLKCNMTYVGHSSCQVISPDLRSNIQIDPLGLRCTRFDAFDKRNAIAFRVFLIFPGSKVICKNVNHTKKLHFWLTCPG